MLEYLAKVKAELQAIEARAEGNVTSELVAARLRVFNAEAAIKAEIGKVETAATPFLNKWPVIVLGVVIVLGLALAAFFSHAAKADTVCAMQPPFSIGRTQMEAHGVHLAPVPEPLRALIEANYNAEEPKSELHLAVFLAAGPGEPALILVDGDCVEAYIPARSREFLTLQNPGT